jgi:sulfur carrier protein
MESAETQTIHIVVNGEDKAVPQGLNVAQLLDFLAINPRRVAVELNRTIVRKQEWSAAVIEEDAQVEVVWFVGGG